MFACFVCYFVAFLHLQPLLQVSFLEVVTPLACRSLHKLYPLLHCHLKLLRPHLMSTLNQIMQSIECIFVPGSFATLVQPWQDPTSDFVALQSVTAW